MYFYPCYDGSARALWNVDGHMPLVMSPKRRGSIPWESTTADRSIGVAFATDRPQPRKCGNWDSCKVQDTGGCAGDAVRFRKADNKTGSRHVK